MFTSSSSQSQRSLVMLWLADGKKQVASLKLPLSGKLADAFNNADQFLDIITGDGQQMYIAKPHVQRAEPMDPPQAKLNQQRRASDKASFNPYGVLGVANSASKETIRAAYIALVKAYHPDRFANVELPPEMMAYASAMLARINLAYEQVSG